MKSQVTKLCLCVVTLLSLLENGRIECFQRLLNRRLKSAAISGENFDAIRNIVSASLTAVNEPTINDEKSDATIDRIDDKSPIVSEDDKNDDNVAAETREAPSYDDESEEEDEDDQQQVRQVDRVAKSIDRQSEMANYDEPEPKDTKDVAKREIRNEMINEYDDDDDDDSEANPEGIDSSIEQDPKIKMAVRSTLEDKASAIEPNKSIKQRDTSSLLVDDASDYEKQIEDQIQQRIDSIKEDIKRQIEKKQQAREIEANNAKFDELEFPNESSDEAGAPSDSSKRSLPNDHSASEVDRSKVNVRSKRRSELDQVEKNEDSKNVAVPAAAVKKRSLAKRVTLVERRDNRKRKDRSSILIPEQGHAEVKDDLPADLTLDPNLRLSRSSNKDKNWKAENSRPARSAPRLKDEVSGDRYRREMSDELEDEKINETPEESSNFLFAPRERSESRGRRRRSRARNRVRSLPDRRKARKLPRRSRRHRATRESRMEEAEERDKREMDEDAALVEYKESFGGFPSDSGGGLGRFKRIRRSASMT